MRVAYCAAEGYGTALRFFDIDGRQTVAREEFGSD
jgi:hypothetical protein